MKLIDREKVVIKGLECCTEPSRKCSECPYVGEGKIISYCATRLIKDALELLKQQEKIIIKYRKADAFLATHGWEWKDD